MNTTTRSIPRIASFLALAASSALAGTTAPEIDRTVHATNGFADARRPMTNPTLFDLALPTTHAHPIAMFHRLPDYVDTTIGRVPMGGDVQVYALQFEIALNERFSIVATKDGYVNIDADTEPLWSDQSGFANLGAGVKYAFLLDPVSRTAASGTLTFELPTGNHDVFQGEGDGAANLIVSGLKLWDSFQFAGGAGVHLEFDDQLASTSFVSAHASYEVCRWFIPLVELNWHHVLDAGDGRPNFSSQAGGLVPAVATFEGFDLLNFGASNAAQNRDLVTAAIGTRARLTGDLDVGLAYEIPLTEEHESIFRDRVTLDLVWTF
ncbi:MAG TPA: hypothetical protein VIM57_09495 [Luteolibacter sp.]